MPKFDLATMESWTGYDQDHLVSVQLPRPETDVEKVQWLDYIHFSVLMDPKYRQPLVAALNIDQAARVSTRRAGSWSTDPRIPDEFELNNDIYTNSGFARGHMAMRNNASWGDNAPEASDSTFFFPNSCPQKQSLNGDEWLKLEQWVGGKTNDTTDKVTVYSGPIFASRTKKITSDQPKLRGIEVPVAYFKVVCFINDGGNGSVAKKARIEGATGKAAGLCTRAYIVPTEEAAYSYLDEQAVHVDDSFHTGSLIYQVSVAEIEDMTKLKFPSIIAEANPIRVGERFNVNVENDIVVDLVEDPRRPIAPPTEAPKVRIVSAMPNPVGGGHDNEWVTIQNLGDGEVDLSNLTLSDNTGSVQLDTVQPMLPYGECLTIHNLGGMRLSNAGEELTLKRGDEILHKARFGKASAGRAVLFGR